MNRLLFAILIVSPIFTSPVYSQLTGKPYWNSPTHLVPLRLPSAPSGFNPEYLDLNNDGKPDALKTMTHNDVPVLWLDDDGNMRHGDTEGDLVNDCLLIDRNKDGFYGGYGDLIIDWVDEDGDGKADLQIVIEYPEEGVKEGGHFMIMRDLDNDNIFNYINYNDFSLRCWDHVGLSDFYEDYSGNTMFMKIHTPTYVMKDLRLNWENPFLFYDPDNDGLTEMSIRVVDSPRHKGKDKDYPAAQLQGNADWISIAVDLDNDNITGNEFDFDFTIGFEGEGFDYMDQIHSIKNLRGLPEADRFFLDARYRKLTELIYPDHESAWDLIFKRGKWGKVNFTYDEDDDNGRWERVEFYEPRDPFKSGWKNGGVDNHKQSDASGDRGEWDSDNSGGGKLYLSKFDGRLHLYGAERGVWRIDQNASYYEGWDRMWMGQEFYPKTFATVVYEDRDNNGFFDYVAYDLDGDTKFETEVDFVGLGISDECQLIDISDYTYGNFRELSQRMADNIWDKAEQAVKVARQYGINPQWYAKWMSPRTERERYSHGYWLAFYIYKDLEDKFIRECEAENLLLLNKAYYGGDWNVMAKKGESGFYFFTDDDKDAIRLAANTKWGKKIVDNLKKEVQKRRKYPLAVPEEPGGHFHDYFCPVHNQLFTFRWDSPKSHLCSACGKGWEGNPRYDHAWIYQIHSLNKDYLYQCMYLYLATGQRTYADYIKSMLLDYASKYDGWFEHNSGFEPTDRHSGKAFAQSLDEANWSTKVAMAYKAIKPLLTPEEVRIIEEGYLRPAARLLLARPAEGNWQMWHNSGIAALGIALEDDSIVNVAINRPGYGYNHLIEKHVNADGWINEGSPHYHYYPLEALLFTANAVECRGYNLFDKTMHDMFSQPVKGTYPDLSFPAHSDGWYGANLLSQTALYEIASSKFNDPVLESVLATAYCTKQRHDSEALLNGRDIKKNSSGKMFQDSYTYDKSGFCMLRNDKNTVALKFGGEGIGHGHPDKLSITVHNGDKELISDFGTSGYGTPDYLQWYKRSVSHNTVVVDGKDQRKSSGNLLSFIPDENGGYAKMQSSTAYPGVDMTRGINLNGDRITDEFSCMSDSLHTYDYVLLFNEKPMVAAIPCQNTFDDWEDTAYSRIKERNQYEYRQGMMFSTSGLDVAFDVADGEVTDIVLGKAPGIPANPTVNDGPGAGDRPAEPCFPLIIRVKGKNMKINANWTIKH